MGIFSKLLKSTTGIDLDRKRILETGEPATATILSIKQTGKAITYGGANIHYQADMLLEIQPANSPAFQARVTHFIPVIEIPQYQPGQVLAVKYDPKDKEKVAIVGIAMPTAGPDERKVIQFPVGMDPAKVEAMILQSEAMKQELDFAGEPAPAQILKVEDTQIRAGANPFYKFHILVEPQNTTPFQATAQGFIAFQDLSKYQVGSRVWVRFDPKDHNKVAIVGGEIAPNEKGYVSTPGGVNIQFPSGMDPAKVRAMILQSEAMEQELESAGEPAPAQILKVEDTQVRWEGNPFYRFQILIEPKDKAPFQATTQGFIALQSLNKYQVGSRVWVRFDPQDHSRVTFIPSTEWNKLEATK